MHTRLLSSTVFAALVAGLGFAAPASAENINADLSLLTPFTDTYDIEHSGNGGFTDTLGFLLGATNRVVKFELTGFGLSFSDGALFDDDGNKLADLTLGGGSDSLTLSGFTVPGSGAFDAFELRVSGLATAGTFYTIGVSAAPVPEPEAWAMLLAGLGLVVGAAARRRLKLVA